MEEKLILNKLEAKDGVLKTVTQTEQEPVVYVPQPVEMAGTIQAPGNFIEKRITEHKALKANVQFSYRGLYIKLRTEEDAEDSHERPQAHYLVTGKLIENPDIKKLQVNTKQRFSVKDLTELLRMNRAFFSDASANLALVSNLQKFKLAAQTEIESSTDNRGNEKELYEIKASSNIDLGFVLSMPLYEGQPKQAFRVEIEYRVVGKQIEVWLTSPDLAEYLQTQAQGIIDAEIKRFPKEFVFVEQ